MLINCKSRNVGPMASGELTFASRLEDEFAGDAEHNKRFDFDVNKSKCQVDIVGCFAIEKVESKFLNNFNRRYT